MSITEISADQLLHASRDYFGLPVLAQGASPIDDISLAASLRRQAGFQCPCSPALLAATLRHSLNQLIENLPEDTLRERIDVVLEMSGHPDAIRLGFKILRLGGRASLLGIPSKPMELNLAEDIIFKGAQVQGINGRLMYKTWYQMNALLRAGKLDLDPVITDRMPMADFSKGMDRLRTGEASKILLYPNGMPKKV